MFDDFSSGFARTHAGVAGAAVANQSLAELTWFRVGGAAQALFMPDDEADLAFFSPPCPATSLSPWSVWALI